MLATTLSKNPSRKNSSKVVKIDGFWWSGWTTQISCSYVLPWLFSWESGGGLTCLCFLDFCLVTRVHPLSSFFKVFDTRLVVGSWDGISSQRTLVPNSQIVLWLVSSSSRGVELYFSRTAKRFTLCWYKGAWCSHKIDVWLASTILSKSRMTLSSLANCMMRSLSVIHFSRGWLMTR